MSLKEGRKEKMEGEQMEKEIDEKAIEASIMNKLRVTTMTLIFGLKCVIDLNKIFLLLPITKIDYKSSTKARTRYKIPHHNVPGSILSMRYRGQTRGIIRSTSGTHFKNSITIDVSLKEKNLNIKLCASKMQMCGAKSVEQGYEGAYEMLKKIDYICRIIDDANSDLASKQATLEYAKKNLKVSERMWSLNNISSIIDKTLSRKLYDLLMFKLMDLEKNVSIFEPLVDEIYEVYQNMDHEIEYSKNVIDKWVRESLSLMDKIEFRLPNEEEMDNLNMDYLNFLVSDYQDYNCLDSLLSKINFISTIDKLYEGELEVDWMNKAMVNFNYSLGNHIDRFQLKQQVNGVDGFFAHYDNSTEHYVTIELPYKLKKVMVGEEGIVTKTKIKKRQNKVPCHSFLVYKSGLVTQSGPDEGLMKEALKKFIILFEKIKEDVIVV